MTVEYDILVVGAGMAGAAMACTLAECGLRIAVIEHRAFTSASTAEHFDPRVVALTIASQGFLERLDVWSSITRQRTGPFSAMHVWDATGTGSIDFAACEVGQSVLGHIVENSVVTEALLDKMQALDIELICPASVASLTLADGVGGKTMLVLDDGRALAADLVIAADGAQSSLRAMAAMETREWSYYHRAIVTTVTTELPHQFTAWQRFSEEGPLAFLPLCNEQGNTNICSIVWSLKETLAEQIMSLDDDEFRLRLGETFEHRLGEIVTVDKRWSFPLQQRHSKSYFRPGLVLIGDAAHTIHPLAGQGINLGFQDVRVLGEEIRRACQRQIPLTHVSILQRYQRRRLGKNLAMMAVMEGFKQLFEQQALPFRWVRNEGMNQINRFSLLKNRIMQQAMGL
ncbi:MAG: FAD-dependent monooxygenase [Pseudomonadales bacterium]|nr:FAD-dependent monooxygenase [Pseudomonadales bacterium]